MTTEPKFKQGDICVYSYLNFNRCFLVLSTDYPIRHLDFITKKIYTFEKDTLMDTFSTIITNDPSVTPDNFADKYPELLI